MRAVALAAAAAGLASAIPTPTPAQLAWQESEIMALIHFNMATFVQDGDPACTKDNWNAGVNSSNPATFWPAQLNVSNWIESFNQLGIHHGVLTAKHGCGFLLWDTNTTLPDGSPYGYAVKRRGSFPRDVLREFAAAMRGAGLGIGWYYSTGNNFYLNTINHQVQPGPLLPGQAAVTQEQYDALVLSQVHELWGTFGPLTEIWFDHGYGTSLKSKVQALLAALQPQAVGFAGLGVTPNPARWVGTESGLPSSPIWSTAGKDGQGDPASDTWFPAACDTTLQEWDHWFYVPGASIRSLDELIAVYHATVGANGVLELDFGIDRTGNVHPEHAARYAELAGWIAKCYGSPLMSARGELEPGSGALLLPAPGGSATVDRVVLREDQARGQRVRAFAVEGNVVGHGWVLLTNGTSVGNKRIARLPSTVTVSELRVVVQEAAAGPVFFKEFSAFAPCSDGHTHQEERTHAHHRHHRRHHRHGNAFPKTDVSIDGGAGHLALNESGH